MSGRAAVASGAVGALALALVAGLAVGRAAPAADGESASGKAVFDRYCAACHADPEPGSRAGPLSSLQALNASTITHALTQGSMRAIGGQLEPAQLKAVVAYLAKPEERMGDGWLNERRCGPDRAAVDLSGPAVWRGFGADARNSRRLTAEQARLTTSQLSRLEVAWVLAMPTTSHVRGAGAVVGDTIFYPAGEAHHVLALDAQTGCVKWATQTAFEINSSLAFGRVGKAGVPALVGASLSGQMLALDARTGRILWQVDPRHDKGGTLSGTPLLTDDRIFVPVSSSDVTAALDPAFPCCKTHGDLVALDGDGRVLWTWHTMAAAKPLGRRNSAGVEMHGPSGASIWSSPAFDPARGVVYTSTGQNTSPPATRTSDAVVAIDAATGRERWLFQGLANDIWNSACPIGPPPADVPLKPNCFFAREGSVLRDHDFGGGPVLFRSGAGRDLVLAGQKSGDVWALDAATGRPVWRRTFGAGTALGGVHWGLAVDGARVFAPISDPRVPAAKSAAGLHALDATSGRLLWSWRAEPACDGGRRDRVPICASHYGVSAPPLVIDGAVLAGSLDGRLLVFDSANGALLATYDTAVPFGVVHGVTGQGGSIDAAGVFAGAGMVFVNSGYGWFGQMAGNVLVAYRPAPAP